MKRFAVYCGDKHYPGKAMEDFIKSFNTLEEAEEFEDEIKTRESFSKYQWTEIVDMKNWE